MERRVEGHVSMPAAVAGVTEWTGGQWGVGRGGGSGYGSNARQYLLSATQCHMPYQPPDGDRFTRPGFQSQSCRFALRPHTRTYPVALEIECPPPPTRLNLSEKGQKGYGSPEHCPVLSNVGEGTRVLCLDSFASTAVGGLKGQMHRKKQPQEYPPHTHSSCFQAFPCEPRPLCTPEEKKHLPPLNDNAIEEEGDETPGDEGEGGEGKTVRELARLCYEDPCRGLLEVTECNRGRGDAHYICCLPLPRALSRGCDTHA